MRACGNHLAAFALALALLVAAKPLAATAQPQPPEEGNCITCHRVLGDERLSGPAIRFPGDIHAAKGLSCVSCHGGDPAAVGLDGMNPAMGFLGKPGGQEMVQFCGRCHSDAQFMRNYNPSIRVDQVAEYTTSVHGRRLLELGDTLVATCVGCHPAHSIKPPADPESSVHPLQVAQTCGTCHADVEYMEQYGIPTDQLQKYQSCIHWQKMSVEGDLSAPTCNDCHGNHGAAPPGISWVGNTCGQCHVVMAQLFNESVHGRMFPLLGVPGCAACHNNHEIRATGDTMLGVGEGAVCVKCHQPGVGGGVGAEAMRNLLDSLRAQVDTARALLERAELAGMEVSHALFELQGAHNALVTARATVHAFSVDALKDDVDEGLEITANAWASGLRALDELKFRRTGLVVSVTLIIGLIVGVVLKIRQMEQRGLARR